ncbi:MAG: Minf_1886 family protein [Verrucomicrobiales bacterium]
MKRPIFDDAVQECLQRDVRFPPEAYYFVRDALDYAQKLQVGRSKRGEPVHLSAAQLCSSLRQYALEQFGPLSHVVLASWTVHSTSDIGEIVYLLIDAGAFARSEGDAREDFNDVFDFAAVFEAPFWPSAKRSAGKDRSKEPGRELTR